MTGFIAVLRGKRLAFVHGFALAVGLALALSTTIPSSAQETVPSRGTITMDGRGTVTVAPDMAVITTNVATTGKTAAEALSENSAAIAKVIDAIKTAGIEAKDIQSRGFGIYPRYERITDGSDRQPNIVGYEVRNGVEVNIRDIAKLGDILSLVVDSGANSVDGIRFDVSDPAEKLDEARKKAVEAARHKAEIFASAAGVELGEILSIAETGTQIPRPQMMRASAMMAASPESVPIEAGEETIGANVTIMWALK